MKSGLRFSVRKFDASKLAHDGGAESEDLARAGKWNERHVAGLARLEAHRGAGRDVEAHAAGLLALEPQGRIGLEEMVVAADLDGPVARIGDRDRHGLAAGIEREVAVLGDDLAGYHVFLLPDRLVHRDQLGAVRKRGLDLDLVDHLGNSLHYLRARIPG